jgi:hypothetical protein
MKKVTKQNSQPLSRNSNAWPPELYQQRTNNSTRRPLKEKEKERHKAGTVVAV